MTTYNIFFTNNYSQGDTSQDYALFSDVPNVTSTTGTPQVYTNAFLTTRLNNGSNWNINITKNYYAWCGTSVQALAPNVTVQVGQGILAQLGTTSAPGSTYTMYNNGGNPAFQPTPTYTANPGAYEIDTGTDFTPNMGFIVGLGAIDNNGRMRPLATIAAPGNAAINIAPVTRFFLAAYSSSSGQIINTTVASKVAATIDFTKHPGQFSAIVSQDATGAFTVTYVNNQVFAMSLAAVQPPAQRMNSQLKQLKYQIANLSSLVDEAMSHSAAALDTKARYNCSLTWVNGPSQTQMLAVLNSLIASMATQGYDYEGGSVIGSLKSQFTHAVPVNVSAATQAWLSAYADISTSYRAYITDPRCVPATSALTAAEKDVHSHDLSVAASSAIHSKGSEHDSFAQDDQGAKRQRALKLLQDEGFGDLGNTLVGTAA